MKKRWVMWLSGLVFLVIVSLATVGIARAQDRAFTLTWSVMGSGGMGGSQENYTLHSTLGQPVAGIVDEVGYHLTSGFWTEVWQVVTELFNFLPLIMR